MHTLTPGELGQLAVILLLGLALGAWVFRALRQDRRAVPPSRRLQDRITAPTTPWRRPLSRSERESLEREVQLMVDTLRARVERPSAAPP